MIISDKYNFVFVHIPKCAGTYLREKLNIYNDERGIFARQAQHPELGFLDYAHIPLLVLKNYFPEEFGKVQNYWSFAIVRNPFERFPSSLTQQIKRYGDKVIHDLTKRELRDRVNTIIEYLEKQKNEQVLLPAKYIHFQRQTDYIFIDNEKVVSSVYAINDLECLQTDFFKYTQMNVSLSNSEKKTQQATVAPNRLFWKVIELSRPITSFVPIAWKAKVLSSLFVSRDRRFNDVFQSKYISDFISEYYADDIKLFNNCSK